MNLHRLHAVRLGPLMWVYLGNQYERQYGKVIIPEAAVWRPINVRAKTTGAKIPMVEAKWDDPVIGLFGD